MNATDSPFSVEPVAELPLLAAPLALVLCQVRWPQVTRVSGNLDEVANALGRALADDYPLASRRQEMQLVVSPQGVTQTPGAVVHVFGTADDMWQVALSETFAALEARQYTSRKDFCERFERVLSALAAVVSIPVVDRVGFRYVNRLDNEEDLKSLATLVKPAVLGGANVPLVEGVSMIHTVGEAAYAVGDSRLLARWAQLPPNSSLDPILPPVNANSWILDLDASREERQPFIAADLVRVVRDLSAIGYAFFRWSTTPAFISRFGGEV